MKVGRFPSTQPFVNPLARVYGPAMHIHGLIEDSASLANLCTRLAQQPFITVDTEFMRENTFWPELCLIQIADTNEAAAIDPMAEGIAATPDGLLIVSDEATKTPATITLYRVR